MVDRVRLTDARSTDGVGLPIVVGGAVVVSTRSRLGRRATDLGGHSQVA
jgi:hypothetical protein